MPSKTNSEIESDQISTEPTTIPEDITAFYDKIDKEDEDEEEDQELKTVSFEVNQVYTYIYMYIYVLLYFNAFLFIQSTIVEIFIFQNYMRYYDKRKKLK